MTLSVEMIAESMQPFGARVVMQQERTFAFRRVQMLTPESENTLEEDVLYVSEPKVIRRLPKGLLHDHFFVVRARSSAASRTRRRTCRSRVTMSPAACTRVARRGSRSASSTRTAACSARS